MDLLYIIWDVDPIIFDTGFYSPRYYTICFMLGLLSAAWIVYRIFQKKGISEDDFQTLAFYLFIGIALGARLGHCLFYDADYYLSHPWEIILPFTFENGQFALTGWQGLASHGGALGLVIALALYCRKTKQRFMSIMDYIAIVTPLTAFFIRLGNLMNSEIIGNVTSVPWAFRFMKVDGLPRHPAQLYEAIAYLILFFINLFLYKRYGSQLKEGFFFGLTMTYIFIFRFFIEFLKENQVNFEDSLSLNMGQILSLPFILAGIYFLFFYKGKNK